MMERPPGATQLGLWSEYDTHFLKTHLNIFGRAACHVSAGGVTRTTDDPTKVTCRRCLARLRAGITLTSRRL